MKKTLVVSVGIAFVFATSFILRAQETAITVNSIRAASAGDLSPMLEAVEATTPLPAESVPPYGTFYSALHANWAPFPANVNNVPAWNLGDGVWLLDDLDQPQGQMRTMAGNLMAVDVPSPGDGGNTGGNNNSCIFTSAYTIDTNRLFLEITGVNNSVASFNLYNASNQVYAIASKSNLLSADWKIEVEVWPDTNQTVMPFTVPTLARQNLFVRAEDWTGVDSDGDGIPDWWIWKYFGNLSEMATNLDANGNTLGYDYANNLVPGTFGFSGVEVANNYVNTSPVTAQVAVFGCPYYLAVSVDDTNYAADASWQVYTGSDITVNLGLTEGWHDVWIGLRGHADAPAAAVWQWKRLKLDWTPPLLVVTNPVVSTVSVPVIQLQGYSPEAIWKASVTTSPTRWEC
jgi:hypothetical protein